MKSTVSGKKTNDCPVAMATKNLAGCQKKYLLGAHLGTVKNSFH